MTTKWNKKMEDECKEMGDRIKQLRKQFGISQDKFATKLGLKQRTLSYIENGNRSISCSVVKKMHKEFGVKLEWIMFGEGEMF